MYDNNKTTIRDGMGNVHEGVYCDDSCHLACPYWTNDVQGAMACYKEKYMECTYRIKEEED